IILLLLDASPLDLPSFPTRRSSDLGAEGDPDGVRQLVHPPLQSPPGVLVERDDLGRHSSSSLRCPSVVASTLLPRVLRVYWPRRSEEHTSELQSRVELVCRLLLEKQ